MYLLSFPIFCFYNFLLESTNSEAATRTYFSFVMIYLVGVFCLTSETSLGQNSQNSKIIVLSDLASVVCPVTRSGNSEIWGP